eukprot:14518005-Alexandrium_andersonii.AAC.1
MASPGPPPGLGSQDPPPAKRSRSATSAPPSSIGMPLGPIAEDGLAEAPGRAPSRARRPERGTESRPGSS